MMFESEPHVAPEQPAPETLQVTPLNCESFCKVAVKEEDRLICTLTVEGETETEIGGGGMTVTVAVADLVESETEVAIRETVAGIGTDAGAV